MGDSGRGLQDQPAHIAILHSRLADLSLFRGLCGTFELERPAGGVHVDVDRVAVAKFAAQNFCGHGVFDPLLDDPLQRPGAVGGVVALFGQQLAWRFGSASASDAASASRLRR